MDIQAFVKVRNLRNSLVQSGLNENESGRICGRIILTLMCEANGFFLGKPFTANILGTKAESLAQTIGSFWESLAFLPMFEQPIRMIIDDTIRNRLIDVAALNWSTISPDLLGSFYEYSLKREEQNAGGIFYTSKDNIHRVIDHLFIDSYYERIVGAYGSEQHLLSLYDDLCEITFLDPACGGGNFLIETLAFLRNIETELILALKDLGAEHSEHIDYRRQIFGIEYDSGAASYARAALMVQNRISDLRQALDTGNVLPPILYPVEESIAVGDSLLINWHMAAGNKISFVFGNPPFIYNKNTEQIEGMALIFDNESICPALDYSAAWIKKASYICDEGTRCAFLTTSSICQGEQTLLLWKDIISNGVEIDFAYRPFIWTSDIDLFGEVAQTYCIIVGFSSIGENKKTIYELSGENEKAFTVESISGYLEDMPNVYIGSSEQALNLLPYAAKTTSYPNYLTEEEHSQAILEGASPDSFLPYIHAKGTLYGKKQYCMIDYDNPFREPKNYLCIPRTSSVKRDYIPILFFEKKALTMNEGVYFAQNASLLHFGLLSSAMHNIWAKLLSGRLANNLRYSIKLVYNTFPIPEISEEQKSKITEAAIKILEIRRKKSERTIASLYDDMPIDLKAAHMKLDYYVDLLYSPTPFVSKKQRLNRLITLYAKQRKHILEDEFYDKDDEEQ